MALACAPLWLFAQAINLSLRFEDLRVPGELSRQQLRLRTPVWLYASLIVV